MHPTLWKQADLEREVSGTIQDIFQVELGIANPHLVDYLYELFRRFMRMDAIFRMRSTTGLRLEQVAAMMEEAEQRQGRPRREAFRHIGDFALFWSGFYPEYLWRLKSPDKLDHLLDYWEQGKRSYYLASQFDQEPFAKEAPTLRLLSHEFELCAYGLNRVRKEIDEWPKRPHVCN